FGSVGGAGSFGSNLLGDDAGTVPSAWVSNGVRSAGNPIDVIFCFDDSVRLASTGVATGTAAGIGSVGFLTGGEPISVASASASSYGLVSTSSLVPIAVLSSCAGIEVGVGLIAT